MLLVERYVGAVRNHLPRRERDDIVAELRETLQSQIETAEAEHGRRLTEDEVVSMLTRYGAPEVVAARYGARDHLIGPAVYPQYRAIVKPMVWIFAALLAGALVFTALTAGDPAAAMARLVGLGVLIAMGNLTIVTLVFARLDRTSDPSDWAARWDPRDLLHGTKRRTAIPRAEMVATLVITAFWLLWWIDLLPLNRWLLWAHLPLAAAPIWDELTPLIVSLMVLNIVVSAVAILRPRWVRLYDAATVGLDVGIGVMLYLALRAPSYVVVTDERAPGASLAGLFNTLVTIGLLAFAVLVVISIGSTLRAHRPSLTSAV